MAQSETIVFILFEKRKNIYIYINEPLLIIDH